MNGIHATLANGGFLSSTKIKICIISICTVNELKIFYNTDVTPENVNIFHCWVHMKNMSMQFNFPKQFVFAKILFFYILDCVLHFFKTHSKDAIKAKKNKNGCISFSLPWSQTARKKREEFTHAASTHIPFSITCHKATSSCKDDWEYSLYVEYERKDSSKQ